MADESAETDQRGGRRPYVKPFVRSLDVEDTEGKNGFPAEFYFSAEYYGGPS
jgi:hypothetical protein